MLHGRAVTYAQAGSGPALLLVHGMGGGYENWREVIGPLARNHTVVAPDLPGHGESDKPRGDYSPGGYATASFHLTAPMTTPRIPVTSIQYRHNGPVVAVIRPVTLKLASTPKPLRSGCSRAR